MWVYCEGAPGVFGEGKARLLEGIRRHGSLKQATEALGFSYRKAWEDLRKAEACLGVALLERNRGGRGGGGTKLTPAAEVYLQAYQALRKGLHGDLETRMRRFLEDVQSVE